MKYAENRTVPSTRYARMHWVPSRRRGFTFGGVFHLELLVELRANQYFASQINSAESPETMRAFGHPQGE